MRREDIAVQIAASRRGVPHARSLRAWVAAALRGASRAGASGAVCVRVVSATESRHLNLRWRGKDQPTNVLSFPFDNAGKRNGSLGDIAICAAVVAREAREQRKAARAHWAHMVVHGVLHLLGHDHVRSRDAAAMEALEVRILKRLGFGNPYDWPYTDGDVG